MSAYLNGIDNGEIVAAPVVAVGQTAQGRFEEGATPGDGGGGPSDKPAPSIPS